jgi:hypothetical protein
VLALPESQFLSLCHRSVVAIALESTGGYKGLPFIRGLGEENSAQKMSVVRPGSEQINHGYDNMYINHDLHVHCRTPIIIGRAQPPNNEFEAASVRRLLLKRFPMRRWSELLALIIVSHNGRMDDDAQQEAERVDKGCAACGP